MTRVVRRTASHLVAMMLVGTCFLWVGRIAAEAGPFVALPSHPAAGVTHLDIDPEVLPAFGADVRLFSDLLFSPDVFHWETEISNVLAVPVAFPVGFFFPSGAILGQLALAPGSSFYIDIHVPDTPPEIGFWFWYAFSTLPFPVGIDTSVREAFISGLPADDFTFRFFGNGSFTFDPTVTPALGFAQVPEPGTLMLLGMGLACVAAGRARRVVRKRES